ncbi:MAG: VCBS repeat-containing protein [Armatimonadetes bacterium]|nr:VCBS repeat-containing protein [Akkermansiaceae bacterium]
MKSTLLLITLLARTIHAEVGWETIQLDPLFYSEGGTIIDIDKDGKMDVVSGPFWYAGPDFKTRHEIYPPQAIPPVGYSEVFLMYAPDINGDGWSDLLIYGWPGKQAWWLENPKGGKEHWKSHPIMDGADGESPAWADLTGDGKPEAVYAHKGSFGYASPPADPTQPWNFTAVTPPDASVQRYTHGLGIGDVDRDGKPDLLDRRGWWKNPAAAGGEWKLNPINFNSNGGAQMFVHDFNGDGKNDILNVSDPHAYGLSWFEQTAEGWTEHRILTKEAATSAGELVVSQLHGVELLDVDGDGEKDIITGKRWWAHSPKPDGTGGDPGGNDPALLFWIKVIREGGNVKFEPKVIHGDSGVGLRVPTGDLNGDGLPDVLTASKKGTLIHVQKPRP